MSVLLYILLYVVIGVKGECSDSYCGIYGICNDNGNCECQPLWKGDDCSIFEAQSTYPAFYKAFNDTFLLIFGIIALLISIQTLWKFRLNTWKRNIPSVCIVTMNVWSIFRLVFYTAKRHNWSRLEQAPIVGVFLWLELFAADLTFTTVFLLMKAWMHVIRDIVWKFAYEGEKLLVVGADYMMIGFLFILYIADFLAIFAVSFNYHATFFKKSYWFILGVETMLLSLFLGTYGKRILTLMRKSNIKSLEDRTRHVSIVISIMGFVAFCTILLIFVSETADADDHPDTWYVFQAAISIIEIATMATVFSLIKDESYSQAYHIRNWIFPSLVTVHNFRASTPSSEGSISKCSSAESVSAEEMHLPGSLVHTM